uniref:Uncharacterized protein n=1 Tax=Romanomermis culicivorax TaxID=13658 RepID=A0A915IBU9_ROMCU
MEERVSLEIEDEQDVHYRGKIAAYRYKLNNLLMNPIFDPCRALDCDFSYAATNIGAKKRYVSYLSSVREATSSQIDMMVLQHEAALRSIENARKSYDEKMTSEICKTVII